MTLHATHTQQSAQPAQVGVPPAKQDYKQLLRKKILIGSCYLKQADVPECWAKLIADLDAYLKRDSDRLLFDLPVPKP